MQTERDVVVGIIIEAERMSMQVQRHIEKVTSQRLVIDVPEAFLNREVEVVVLLVEDEKHGSLSAPNGDRAADLLAKISQNDGARCFGDPIVWQRKIRTEHFFSIEMRNNSARQ